MDRALAPSVQTNRRRQWLLGLGALALAVAGWWALRTALQPSLRRVDVHVLLRNLGRLLGPQSAERRVTWHWELVDAPLIIEADAPQLEQALLNVTKNALEAIGEGGNIWVCTTSNTFSMSTENDGFPLAAEVRERLFTGFFSTKRGGQGIGLTLVRDVLLAHGFAFGLASGPGGRTAFTISLP